MARIALLGCGFTGSVVIPLLSERGHTVTATRRSPAPGYHRFDLNDPSSWDAAAGVDACILLFPAEPPARVQQWIDQSGAGGKRIVVVGTTSSYLLIEGSDRVTEENPLDLSVPRVEGEELLRKEGAVVLRSSGIYGRSGGTIRNPLDWLRRGLIRDGTRFVNLIHVGDLARAIVAALDAPVAGKQFIISDGTPRRWDEIAEWARQHGLVDTRFSGATGERVSKRLSNAAMLRELLPELLHPDLFAEIFRLEGKTS